MCEVHYSAPKTVWRGRLVGSLYSDPQNRFKEGIWRIRQKGETGGRKVRGKRKGERGNMENDVAYVQIYEPIVAMLCTTPTFAYQFSRHFQRIWPNLISFR